MIKIVRVSSPVFTYFRKLQQKNFIGRFRVHGKIIVYHTQPFKSPF
jgi:hypothetical protein